MKSEGSRRGKQKSKFPRKWKAGLSGPPPASMGIWVRRQTTIQKQSCRTASGPTRETDTSGNPPSPERGGFCTRGRTGTGRDSRLRRPWFAFEPAVPRTFRPVWILCRVYIFVYLDGKYFRETTGTTKFKGKQLEETHTNMKKKQHTQHNAWGW